MSQRVELVCPECESDDLMTVDQLDYGVWAKRCLTCGWEGTSEQLKRKEAGIR